MNSIVKMQPLLQSIKKHLRCILMIIHALLYFDKYNPPLLNESIIFQKYVHVFKQTCTLNHPFNRFTLRHYYEHVSSLCFPTVILVVYIFL